MFFVQILVIMMEVIYVFFLVIHRRMQVMLSVEQKWKFHFFVENMVIGLIK